MVVDGLDGDKGILLHIKKSSPTPVFASNVNSKKSKSLYQCKTYDKNTFKWVEDNCFLHQETEAKIVCQCTHLSDFTFSLNANADTKASDFSKLK